MRRRLQEVTIWQEASCCTKTDTSCRNSQVKLSEIVDRLLFSGGFG